MEVLKEKKMKPKKVLMLGCWLTICLITGPHASWSEDLEDEKSVEIESVTVTANKIEEDIRDVPQSITVIDEHLLDEKGIKDVAGVISEIPNMTLAPIHGNAVNFRGLNASMFTNNNPVVLYIDGVPCTDQYGFDASLANVERIEVLRGPQGTLYGKDAIGGIINIVTKDPDNAFQGKAGAEYGSFDFMHGLINGSGPLVKDKLYLGINGQYRRKDGWVENTHSGMDEEANEEEGRRISGYLLFKPTVRLRARLVLSNDYTRKSWMDGYGLPGGSDISDFDRDEAEHVDFDVPTEEEFESNSQSLNLAYDFGSATLTSTTTHRKLAIEGQYDGDHANDPLFSGLTMFDATELDSWNQELRLSSNQQDGIRWVGGVYFDVEERDQGPYGMQFPMFDPVTFDFLGNFEMNAESVTDSSTAAVFGQVIVPLGSQFELTLGGRYQRIDKEFDLSMYYLPVGMTGDPMYTFKGDKSWDAFLPKAALTWRVSAAWRAYVSYSQGYMPGGFNYFAMAGTEADNSFEPQRSTNYELGMKGALDRLRMAASVFYMDIEDIHVYKAIGTMYLTDNADSAHSQGAEMELAYRLTDSLELTGAVGIIDAEYDDYDAGGGVTFDGEKIQNTPSHTLRLGVAYLHPRGFYSRLDMKNQGEIYFYDDANKAMVKEDGHTVIDAKIGYQFNAWDLYLYGKNLTDEAYITDLMSNNRLVKACFGDPRTIGANWP